MKNHLRSDEEGSILLAMMAIVAIGGMIVATFSLIQQSTQTTRRDISYTSAIQVADAGVQQALTYLSTVSPATDQVAGTTCPTGAPSCTSAGLNNATDGGTFDWIAVRDGFTWEVTARGTVGDVSRTIEALVERPSRFFLAAFGDQYLTLRGGNVVDSYNSDTCGLLASCPKTGNGAVGSNGSITLNGNADVDGVFLYGPGASCTGAECTDPSTEGGGSSAPIDVQELHDLMTAEAAVACPSGPVNGLYRSSTSASLVGGNIYCFSGVVFDTAVTTLTPDPTGADRPVTIFVFSDGVDGNQNHQSVNMPAGPQPPTPSNLVINVLAGDVLLRNQSNYAFAILAPLSVCTKSGSNAQTNVYGSLICGSLDNVGGWKFHFDDALLNSGVGTFDITAWREEVGSSTSF